MAFRNSPSVSIDWNAGEADFILGERLAGEHPTFKVDVLGDLKTQIADAYDEAYDELYPGLQGREQRSKNIARRLAAESIVGLLVTAATLLRTGHVAITFSNGKVLVLCSDTGDVHLRAADDAAQAVECASAQMDTDWYLAEPTQRDRDAQRETEIALTKRRMLNICAP